jgi:hypothetical protein
MQFTQAVSAMVDRHAAFKHARGDGLGEGLRGCPFGTSQTPNGGGLRQPANKQTSQGREDQKPMNLARWLESWRKTTISNKFISGASVIVAAATVVYAVVSSFQLSVLRESNRINRSSLESVQRAFLVASSRGVEAREVMANIGQGEKKYVLWHAQWENAGATPAPISIGWVEYDIVSNEQLSRYPFTPRTRDFVTTVVGPKAPFESGPVLIPEDLLIAKPPGLHVILWGWECYEDIFYPKTRPHLTEFCWDLQAAIAHRTGTSPSGPIDSWSMGFVACPEHNCVDQYCADYDAISSYLPR